MNLKEKRAIEINEPVVNEEVIAFSVASSEPYLRKAKNDDYAPFVRQGEYFWESLEISEEAIDFKRLIDGRCPFIMEHDQEKQLGVVEKAYINEGKLYVDVRFSTNAFAQKVLKDITDGIRRNVSLGYNVYGITPAGEANGIPMIRITQWEPYETSSVSCPADPTVGYKRSIDEEEKEEEVKEEKACEGGEKKSKKSCEENPDAAEIRALGKAFNRSVEAEVYIKEKKSLNEFKTLLTNSYKEKNNMTEELKKFNVARALLNKQGRLSDEQTAYERSVIAENRRAFNKNGDEIVVTKEQLRAGFDGTADAALHPAEYRPDLYAGTLAKENTLDRVNPTVVGTAGESISFAVCTSGLNSYYVDPNNPVPSGNPAFAQKTLTPHTYGARTFISHLSRLQDRPEAAAIAMDELLKGMDYRKDIGAFQGTGSSGEPTGLLNTAGLNTVSLTGTVELSTALAFEKAIRDSGDYSSDLKWVFGTEAYYKWANTPVKSTALNEFLVDYKTGTCIGYEAICSPAVPTSAVILGNFKEMLVADFGGIILSYTQDSNQAASDSWQINGIADNDVVIRRPASFTKGV